MGCTVYFWRDDQSHEIRAEGFLFVLARHFGWEGFPDLRYEPVEDFDGCRQLVPAAQAEKLGRALKAALPHIPDEDASHIYDEYRSKIRLDAPRDVFLTAFTPSHKEEIRRLAEFCLKGAFHFDISTNG